MFAVPQSRAPPDLHGRAAHLGSGPRTLNQRQLAPIDIGVFFRPVARVYVPDETDDHAHNCTKPEGRPPLIIADDPGEYGNAEAGSSPNTRKNPAVRASPFRDGDPLRYELIRGGIHNAFTRSQSQPNQDENQESVSEMRASDGCECCEYTPPDNACGKDQPWAETICQPTADYLKRSIPDQKCAENPA